MWQTYKPVANKVWLFLIAGLMWSGVGLILCSHAYRWLMELHSGWAVLLGLAGLVCALVAYRFGFSRMAQKNIRRLHTLLDQVFILAFMPLKSYLLVAGMMSLGIVLRRSPIPHVVLSVPYSTIGGALFLASLHYYQTIWQMVRSRSRANLE